METIVINRAIKYRIYPNEDQKDLINKTFGCVRKVYNMGLELQQGLHTADMKSMSRNELNQFCNHVWKDELEYLREVDKFALTNSLFNLSNAFKNFFDKKGRYPRFKSKKDHKMSYTTNATNGNIAVERTGTKCGRIKLPKLGWVEACIHRDPEPGAVLKNATISMSQSGKYYVSILFAITVEAASPVMPDIKKTLGLDYSSPLFYVDSEGCSPEVPHAFRRVEQRLAKEQKRLARMVKGSKNYEKQRLVIARLHERASNQRKDFCHKESRKIANSWDIVCVEDIDLRAMSGALRLGKSTMDNGFGLFRGFLQYKLEEQGKHFVVIDKWYPSTKTCNHCGTYYSDIQLGQKEWTCPHCHKVLQRDPNAAKNIRDEGFRTIKQRMEDIHSTSIAV